MNAIEILKREHDLIERVLNLLCKCVEDVRAGREMPDGFASWVVEFIREFADGRHHRKEERILFPTLEARGIPREGGPIGVMLHEHEVGRSCVRRMQAALDSRPFDLEAYADAAEEYAALLWQHILKENNVLFAMAERCLRQDDLELIAEYFEDEDADGGGNRFRKDVEFWEDVINMRAVAACR